MVLPHMFAGPAHFLPRSPRMNSPFPIVRGQVLPSLLYIVPGCYSSRRLIVFPRRQIFIPAFLQLIPRAIVLGHAIPPSSRG